MACSTSSTSERGTWLPTAAEIADQVIEWVEATVPGESGVGTQDRNDRLLVAAYGRAYRCFVSIRELAGRGEADDAAVLTRTLFSITLQSLYLIATDDPTERQRRFRRAGRTYFENVAKIAREEVAAGVEPEVEAERAEANVARLKEEGVPPMPSEYDIARELDITNFYTRVYRPGSNVAHYSIGSALDGFAELTHSELIGSVALQRPDFAKAEEVLIRAVLTYGVFLEKSEDVMGHGLTERLRPMLVEYFKEGETDEPTV